MGSSREVIGSKDLIDLLLRTRASPVIDAGVAARIQSLVLAPRDLLPCKRISVANGHSRHGEWLGNRGKL